MSKKFAKKPKNPSTIYCLSQSHFRMYCYDNRICVASCNRVHLVWQFDPERNLSQLPTMHHQNSWCVVFLFDFFFFFCTLFLLCFNMVFMQGSFTKLLFTALIFTATISFVTFSAPVDPFSYGASGQPHLHPPFPQGLARFTQIQQQLWITRLSWKPHILKTKRKKEGGKKKQKRKKQNLLKAKIECTQKTNSFTGFAAKSGVMTVFCTFPPPV